MDIQAAFDMLRHEMGVHGLSALGWVAKMDDAKKRFGVCRMGPREISLSRPLVLLNPEEEVRDTILHEIAHALAWIRHRENFGHDWRWKKICEEIGARPERCYDEEVITPDFPWALCHRETGEIFSTYQRRPKRDASQLWIRGRKEETLGKLVYQLNPKLYPDGPIARFDKLMAGELRREILAAIRSVTEARGIELVEPRLEGNEAELAFSLRLVPGGSGERDPGRREFELLAPRFGLAAGDFRRLFRSGGERYQLVALKPANRKYPVIGLDARGRRYKFPLAVLADLM